MNTVFEEIAPIVQEVWNKHGNGDFWKTFAKSYFRKDNEACDEKKFITAIAFYPHLIQTLIGENSNANIEITFFSTLLPRHYWNFPLPFDDKSKKDSNFYSKQIPYIDEYRKSIKETLDKEKKKKESDKGKFKLNRILLLTANQDGCNLFGGHLFDYRKIFEDKKAKVPNSNNNLGQQLITWEKVFENKSKFHDNNLSHLPKDYFIDATTIKDEKRGLEVYENKREIKGKQLYSFPKLNKEGESVFDYYIKNLHSSENEARYIIFDRTKENKTPAEKGFFLTPCADKVFFKKISLDSALIKFNNEEFILDVYMDIVQNIISIKVISERERDFIDMKKEFIDIEKLALSLPTNGKRKEKPKEDTENKNELYLKLLKEKLVGVNITEKSQIDKIYDRMKNFGLKRFFDEDKWKNELSNASGETFKKNIKRINKGIIE